MRGWNRRRIALHHEAEAGPVPIVADGLISTAIIGEGRMNPLVILDTTSRPDIDDLVRAHGGAYGDAESGWSKKSRFDSSSFRLVLQFSRPSQCLILIEFDIETQGVLVDQILHSKGLWLQPGQPGDRLGTTLNAPRILVEVPLNKEFRDDEWEPAFRKAIFKRLRREGLSRTDAKQTVDAFISKWREAFHRRMHFARGDASLGEPVDETRQD